ncbi:uncharacterized protein ARMOST_21025 [Armillaria ostoyae]|uniref:Zinc finger PHD-type domain-containing protein n=1 Tax=Armillaria ostoyae TaxID=47428 RepID=A0A284S8Z7_ARMOS|nr:uncharacterized protein ARMOST_21025 [Armillaria ostoyae]
MSRFLRLVEMPSSVFVDARASCRRHLLLHCNTRKWALLLTPTTETPLDVEETQNDPEDTDDNTNEEHSDGAGETDSESSKGDTDGTLYANGDAASDCGVAREEMGQTAAEESNEVDYDGETSNTLTVTEPILPPPLSHSPESSVSHAPALPATSPDLPTLNSAPTHVPSLPASPPATTTEPEANEIIASGLMLRRSGRAKHRIVDLDDLQECYCGRAIQDPEKSQAVLCSNKGCKTIWFHLECLQVDYVPVGWRCNACAKKKRKTLKRRQDRVSHHWGQSEIV